MATRTTRKPNHDQSVANEPDEAAPRGAVRAQQAPAEGRDPRTTKATSAGIEDVPGFKLKSEANAAEFYRAPTLEGLRDIGEASFGAPPPAPATVIGADDRVRITATSTYPWRAHASLLITAADGSQWIGTAWFIGPHTLATAGHCLFINNSGVPGRDGWVRSISVMPGRNANTLPYGAITSTNFRSVRGWTESRDQNFDYGAIILSRDLGNQTGWFGFGVFSDADTRGFTGNISGYPGDKPAGTQWYHARRVEAVSGRKVYYDIDTFGGQSGSAVYRIANGQRHAFAIHAYGVGGGSNHNSGTRIVKAVYDNLVAWKA